MKKQFLFGVISLFSICLTAQTNLEKRGSELFDNYDYLASIETLEAVPEKNIDVLRKLTLSHDKMGNFEQAEMYGTQICNRREVVPNDYLILSRLLMKNQKYEEAEVQLKKYGELKPGDIEVENFKALLASLEQYKESGKVFQIKNLDWNSEEEDFAPFQFDGKLYFTSTRTAKVGAQRTWSGNHMPFLDIYEVALNNGASGSKPIRFQESGMNSKFHEGPIAFSQDGTEMYLTRNNYSGMGTNGVRNFSLLYSKKNGN